MNKTKRLEWYEKRYLQEIDVRDKVETKIKTPATLFPIVFALIAYFAKTYYLETYQLNQISVGIFAGLSCIYLILSLYFFSKTIYGYTYKMLPAPQEIEAYIKEVGAHYEKTSPAKSKKWTEEAIEEFLFNSYVSYTTQNTRNNDKKAYNLSLCIGTIIASFIAISAAFVLFWLKLKFGEVL